MMNFVLQNQLKFKKLNLLIGFILSLAGCALGPDFKKPDPPKVTSFTETPVAEKLSTAPTIGGAEQNIVIGVDIPAEWWTLYHSPELNEMITRAIKRNPNLGAADATLRVALENANAQFGSLLLPSISGNAFANRQQINSSSYGLATDGISSPGPSIYNVYNTSVNLSYTLDFFGRNRRAVESAVAKAEIQQFILEGTYLSLTANVVTTAIKEAATRAQYESNNEIFLAQKNLADVIEKQLEIGTASRVALSSQRALAASSKLDLLNIEKSLAFTRNQLAVYVGDFPGDSAIAKFDLSKLKLPENIPLSIPSELVRQRPDIRAAEAYMKSTNALVGVATANLLPQITLTSSIGSQALTTGALFSANSAVWSIGGGLLQPIFQGGALLAQRRGAIAQYESAVFQYQSTVLTAFQEVANALQALDLDAQALQAASVAERNSHAYWKIVEQQYQLGTSSYLDVLVAQNQYQKNKFALIQAQANRFSNTAALFVALGGGWWNRNGPAYSSSQAQVKTEDGKQNAAVSSTVNQEASKQ